MNTIRAASSLGRKEVRDQAHDALLALYRAGNLPNQKNLAGYVREVFSVGGRQVRVMEYFRSPSQAAEIRYEFRVTAGEPPQKETATYRLQADPKITDAARQKGVAVPQGTVLWALIGVERSEPRSLTSNYGCFTAEPSYDRTKTMVTELIEGRSSLKQGRFLDVQIVE
jgi:hypothetical protein